MPLYLGLDSSTQSLSAIVLEAEGARRRVAFESSLLFDDALPHYHTRHGVLPSDDPATAASPPLLWAEALDVMMARLAQSGLDLSRLAAVSGSAQQHGSVYLNAQGARHAGQAGPRAAPRRADRRDFLEADRTHLDGFEHVGRVRGNRGRGRRRPGAGAADRLARVRALHGRADQEVFEDGSGRLRRDRSHSPRQLVPRLAADRRTGADGSRRRVRHEPHGPRGVPVVASRPSIPRRRARREAARDRAGLDRRRHALAVLAEAARPSRGESDRVVRRQPVQSRRRRTGSRRPHRRFARDERHRVRPDARAACRSHRDRARVRRADGRVHGADLFQERLARPRAHARRVRPVVEHRSRRRSGERLPATTAASCCPGSSRKSPRRS